VSNYAIQLKYDGTGYHGFQRQSNAVTIQGLLEAAISALTGCDTAVIGCGRTDSGVHALDYTANFRSDTLSVPLDRLPFALNALLPADVVVISAREVPFDFHSVFSCVSKEYTYKILNTKFSDPFLVNRVWHIPQPLDIAAMRAAAAGFIGTHDFSALRCVGTDVKTSVRTVYTVDISENNGIIECTIAANGFLYKMARGLTGTIYYAGTGKIKPGDIADILKSGNRALAGPTAPPQGLYLTKASYDKLTVNNEPKM
jgi:tRNA pseudouridine38-40 synthase